ncbi:SDR family NAD(P)-dependent oxidoreductase [Cohnella cellulosilytica]|uniref:SDR family NAD(P)-dependent oxidoreductase n=1 Tax=Cohnella cellulosilytica TaxID=986710 RepID=A0ABW2FDJ9_9BACL
MSDTDYLGELIPVCDPYTLENKTILITGASSGIGRATARIASLQGANVILVGRHKKSLLQTLDEMENRSRHGIEEFDLNEIDAIPDWLKSITKNLGIQINGLAHFAGIHETVPLRVIQRKSMDAVMNVNLYSALALLKACTNKNVFMSGGSIVLTSSVMGQVGQAGVVTYSASKGAVIATVKSSALELAKSKIRVNAVVPGMVHTNMFDDLVRNMPEDQFEKMQSYHPLGFGEPEDVAHSVIYLLSDAAKWVTGTALVVDGGYTCH